MELNYEYDLWQFKNMIEGREELDLDWMSKMFESYFKGYYELEEKVDGLQEEVDYISEETTLEDQMFMVDSELRRRIRVYDKLRTEKGFSYISSKTGIPFLSDRFEWIDLTECAVLNSDEEDEEADIIPKCLLGCKYNFEEKLTKFMDEKVKERERVKAIKIEELRVKNIELIAKEKAEYERLKAKYGRG